MESGLKSEVFIMSVKTFSDWDMLSLPVISGALLFISGRFRPYPMLFPLASRRILGCSGFFPVRGSSRMGPVPVRVNSGRKTAAMFRVNFPPVPL